MNISKRTMFGWSPRRLESDRLGHHFHRGSTLAGRCWGAVSAAADIATGMSGVGQASAPPLGL